MKHSNRQVREEDYARQNREYLEEKRSQLRDFRKGDQEEKKKKNNGFCCLSVVVLILLSVALVLYFVLNVKDLVIEDYINKRQQIESMIPQGKEEVKQGVEQGAELFHETQETIENVQDKYEKAQQLYDEGKETIEKINDAKEQVEEIIQ